MGKATLFQHPAKVTAVGSFLCEESNPFLYALHKHDLFSQVLFIEEGEGTFNINGVSYEIGSGTALFYHRGIWHEEISTKHPFKATYFSFTGLQMEGLPPDFFLEPYRPPLIKGVDVSRLVMECHTEFLSGRQEAQTAADHWFGLLLLQLARDIHYDMAAGISAKPLQSSAMRARSYIEENYWKEITIETVARATYVNGYHLAHLFKNEVGVSVIQFLIRYRMEVAKRYLATSDLSIKEIGELVGYQSETSFHNIFKKITGTTPGKFRSEAK